MKEIYIRKLVDKGIKTYEDNKDQIYVEVYRAEFFPTDKIGHSNMRECFVELIYKAQDNKKGELFSFHVFE
jgi:hypothetical protein